MVETFTIVAFRYNQKNSVFYRNTQSTMELAAWVENAIINYKADVISIRRVYNGEIKSASDK